MSIPLMTKITSETNSVVPNVYPSVYNGLGYNTSDCFLLALETGIYKWCQDLCAQWENVECPCVGVVASVPPVPFAATVKTKITIAPLAGMDDIILSPYPNAVVVPGALRLCTFLHQAFNPDYPLSFDGTNPLNTKEEYAKAFFEAVCMWMNSLWLISINDPTNPAFVPQTLQGTGVILFPGVKVMGDLFAKVIAIYKPSNPILYFSIFAFFLMLGVQGNLPLPIPTIGTTPNGVFTGLTCPLPFPLLTDLSAPSLPSLPSISLPNITLPKFTLPPFPTFTIPQFPGLPGLPDISFTIPEINLDFVLPILGLSEWWELVLELIKKLQSPFPFTLGGFEFWTVGAFKFQIPNIGPFTLPEINFAFDLTLPEFCATFNLFNLSAFKLPPFTLLAWLPTVLACSDGLDGAMAKIDENSNDLHREAFTSGTISGIELSAIMLNMCTSGSPPPPVPILGGFSTGFSTGFEVYIYDAYIPEEEDSGNPLFCRSNYNIFTSATFAGQINSNRNNAFNNADSYASRLSIFATGDIETIPQGSLYTMNYNMLDANVLIGYKSINGRLVKNIPTIPFVTEY